jgi:hypothetical protein
VNAQETVISSLRHDSSSRRSLLSKLESWVSDEDAWRSSADSRISLLAQDTRQLSESLTRTQSAQSSQASRHDLKLAGDAASLTATAAVAAALGPVQTHLERELEGIRRHVAALRAGGSAAGLGELSQEEVERALEAERPSELLVKSAVGNAVREMREEFEDRFVKRVDAGVASAAAATKAELMDLLPGEVTAALASSGLGPSVAGIQSKLEERERTAAKAAEDEVARFLGRVEDNAAAIEEARRERGEAERAAQAQLRALERQVEDARRLAGTGKEDLLDRVREVAREAKERELAQREELRTNTLDLKEQVREVEGGFRTEMAEVARRLAVSESTGEQPDDPDEAPYNDCCILWRAGGGGGGRRGGAGATRGGKERR